MHSFRKGGLTFKRDEGVEVAYKKGSFTRKWWKKIEERGVTFKETKLLTNK